LRRQHPLERNFKGYEALNYQEKIFVYDEVQIGLLKKDKKTRTLDSLQDNLN